ncbi:hypothetical protein PI124_g21461 [Phytophthora idaei]|nr:hypothetical protein PI125_g22392 [Phytophthora idaei]KAG3133226.1 hypothetical protein PI126_g19271 [Phytophthora idaei]KAG3233465.1 hypothetical protein PI124_g21461 [Phytophthora idaei]
MADVDDGSSTESESFEPDQEEHAPVNASVESTTPISTTLGINILDLQAVLLSAPPAPVAPPPSKPTTGSFVIPRRPIPKPTDTPQSSRCGSTSDHSRAPPPDAFPRHCKHSLTHPIVARAKPQVETFSCTCCERKEMGAPNFSKTQRKEYKAPTRKCRDCTCDLPLTSAVRRQSRERRRSQDKRTPAPERGIEERRTAAMRQEPRSAPQQYTTPTRISCQRRLQQIRETRAEERCSDVQRTFRWLETGGNWATADIGTARAVDAGAEEANQATEENAGDGRNRPDPAAAKNDASSSSINAESPR